MASEHLTSELSEGILTLTLNRPEALNALGGDMLSLLLDALRGLSTDAEIGCVVLTGAGRGFCAGGDMKARAAGDDSLLTAAEAGMDRLRGAKEALDFVRANLFDPPTTSFDAAFSQAAQPGQES